MGGLKKVILDILNSREAAILAIPILDITVTVAVPIKSKQINHCGA